jgi:transposase
MRPEGSAEELERRRKRAVKLVNHGESPNLVARILGVHETTVHRWRRMARAKPQGLDAKPNTGPSPRLSEDQLGQLKELLLLGAKSHGWHNELWTAARAACLIEREFGLSYHPEHVRKILKQRLGWTSQKPEQHHKNRDDKAIECWVKESFPQILLSARARGAHLCFIDETGFQLEPTVRRTFAPRGQTPVHRIGAPHERISVIGAIIVPPSLGSAALVYGMLDDNQNYQGPTLVAFLRTLQMTIPVPLTVIWDQIPIHECEAVEDYLAAERDVVAEPLPPYAPELNPADGIWRYVKYGRLPNYTPPALDVLRTKIVEELERLRDRPDLLKSFVLFTKLFAPRS